MKTWFSKESLLAWLCVFPMLIWEMLVPMIHYLILIFQPFLCHIKLWKWQKHCQFFSFKSGCMLDGDNSVTLKNLFNCSGCPLNSFSFWIMFQKVFATISQFGQNVQIRLVLLGTIIQSHYVWCCPFVSVPEENEG